MAQLLPTFFVAAAGVCLLLVLLALWHSLRQVFVGESGARAVPRASLNEAQRVLTHEKDELLAAIRELRFEHELGKVNDADLQRFEQRYRSRARDVLRMLDEQLEPHREQAQALIERALKEGPKPAASETPAAEASKPAEPARAVCPSCTVSNEPDAVFCKKCGTRLHAESP